MPLLGIIVLRETVDFHARRTNSVVHDAAQFAQLVDVPELLDVHDGLGSLNASRHSSRPHHKSGGVGDGRLLKADLRAVCERRHHRRILTPLVGPAFLSGRVSVGVL